MRLVSVLRLMRDRYHDPQLSLRQAAADVHVSPYYLSRLIKAGTGMGFARHVRAARIRSARDLLEKTTLSVKEIAAAVGYSHSNDLDRNFKAECGVTPKIYRAIVVAGMFDQPDVSQCAATNIDQSQ